jgi:hypothetical protein
MGPDWILILAADPLKCCLSFADSDEAGNDLGFPMNSS